MGHMETVANAVWNHVNGCAESNLNIRGEGPKFKDSKMICMDAIAIIEARMNKNGGLDFEANFEWLFTSLVETQVHSRVEFFQSLLDTHQLSMKQDGEELSGVSIALLRLIANGHIFNPRFIHPMDTWEKANEESAQCLDLLEQWIKSAEKVQPWGALTLMKDSRQFPSRAFGKLKDDSHPRLHPTRNQKPKKNDIRLFIPSKGCLPMGSFCGTHGYGLIHPNTINAAVRQLSFASSHSDAEAHWAAPWDSDPREKPEQIRAPFDMMSVAPIFDLQLESCVADHTAKTIVKFGSGPIITEDRAPAGAPGSGLWSRSKGIH